MFQQTHLSLRARMVWDLSGPRRSRRDGDTHTRQDCHLHRVQPTYLLPSLASHSRFVSRQRTFPSSKGARSLDASPNLTAASRYQVACAYFVRGLKSQHALRCGFRTTLQRLNATVSAKAGCARAALLLPWPITDMRLLSSVCFIILQLEKLCKPLLFFWL